MKHLLVALSVAVATVSLGLAPSDADAKRLGSNKPAGMQRQAPPPSSTPTNTPPSTAPTQGAAPAAAATTGAAAAAAAPKRSWLGPVAGLAAGLGLAALASHFGFGEALANFMTMALLAIVAVIAIRFLMNRFGKGAQRQAGGMGGPQLAGAGAPVGGWQPQADSPAQPAPMQRSTLQDTAAAPAAGNGIASDGGFGAAPASVAPAVPAALPGGMDRGEFERLAKMVFIRMQAANDAANLDDLRKFTTPELFASLRLDLQERGSAKQQTDVVEINAQVADVAQEGGQDIVTVRFTGLIRETPEAGAEPFHELWHLVRPAAGGDWAIAGITPVH